MNTEDRFGSTGPDQGAADAAGADNDTAPQEQTATPDEPVAETGAETDRVSELETALAERTDDLKRLQAEYVNYKKRVDRDRDLARRAGAEKVINDLLGTLDNIASARQHEEMSDGFKAVASSIERLAEANGLVAFGTQGEAFDPNVHEAMMQTQQSGISEPTVADVLQVGYRLGDRVLRPARVIVAQPGDEEPVQEG
ncbi:nucleotide exchange factor GrpE [Naumannella halotolerans]|uniref:Protein GrpE n=1 Tax=Naumannella halotolerans TaxID=993414 RepID=A0A4R7JDH0_9ACTN|nr:nucleotide exchange factor GrpE [Naumannella halotolerans]TDT34539.1 molecular chaperone GrpE [Naumannella halotolerans]